MMEEHSGGDGGNEDEGFGDGCAVNVIVLASDGVVVVTEQGGDLLVAGVDEDCGGDCDLILPGRDDGTDESVGDDDDGDDDDGGDGGCILKVGCVVSDGVLDCGGALCGDEQLQGWMRNHTEGDCVSKQLLQTQQKTPQSGPPDGGM